MENATVGIAFGATLAPEQPTIAHDAANIPNKNNFDIMQASILRGNPITLLTAKTTRCRDYAKSIGPFNEQCFTGNIEHPGPSILQKLCGTVSRT